MHAVVRVFPDGEIVRSMIESDDLEKHLVKHGQFMPGCAVFVDGAIRQSGFMSDASAMIFLHSPDQLRKRIIQLEMALSSLAGSIKDVALEALS